MIKSYCLIGLGDTEGIKEDVTFVSESTANYVCGKGLLIATFTSTLHITEIEEFLNMNERDYIMFEMLPSTFSANLNNPEFQMALFGGEINNYKDNSYQHISEGIKDFIKTIKEEMYEDGVLPFINQEEEELLDVDDILDKINKVGLNNLTDQEKEILNNHSTDK